VSDYKYDEELKRFVHAETGATVQWHLCGAFRFSFDIRSDASRFIIVRAGFAQGDVLVAKGLIEGDAYSVLDDVDDPGPAPRAIFDERPAVPEEVSIVAVRMLEEWERMRARLLVLRDPRAWVT